MRADIKAAGLTSDDLLEACVVDHAERHLREQQRQHPGEELPAAYVEYVYEECRRRVRRALHQADIKRRTILKRRYLNPCALRYRAPTRLAARPSNARPRRQAARRALGARSSQDPGAGDDDGESEPAGVAPLAGAPLTREPGHTGPRYVRIRRVELIRDTLRLTVEIRNAASCDFLGYATALRFGTLVGLQVSDNDRAGATGRPIVDALIAERTLRRLTHARAGATVAKFDRGRTR